MHSGVQAQLSAYQTSESGDEENKPCDVGAASTWMRRTRGCCLKRMREIKQTDKADSHIKIICSHVSKF